MAYRYPISRHLTGKRKLPIGRYPQDKEPEEVMGLVQGAMPDSIEEWRLAMALYKCGYDFTFQKAVQGGKISGGQVVDFWITSTFRPTPVLLHGEAWHNKQNSAVDDYKLSKLKRIYYGQIREPRVIWASEVPSIEEAVKVVKERI